MEEVAFYAESEQLGLQIPYEWQGVPGRYILDFLVRLANGKTVLLEIKRQEDERARAKHQAAKRWVAAVNNWGNLGQWGFQVAYDPDLMWVCRLWSYI